MNDTIAPELTSFLLQGVAAWLRPAPGGQKGMQRVLVKPQKRSCGGLAVLLANMIES
jgi:hypothetical protein